MSEPVRYLSLAAFAERIGVTTGTLQRYSAEGRLPAPDALIGDDKRAVRGWLPETVDTWQANRTGRGYRSDLKAHSA